MKKIPMLFVKQFDEKGKYIGITTEVQPGMEWVLQGQGEATLKVDGTAVAIIDGRLYRRYDAKFGKKPPRNAIPCIEKPDETTGHWPHWVPLENNFSAKWHSEAAGNTFVDGRFNGEDFWHIKYQTFEAIGPHFQANPYHLEKDILVPHGNVKIIVPRDFDGLKQYLESHNIEGIVFWKDGEPQCKIRRKDFGFAWPVWPCSPFRETNI